MVCEVVPLRACRRRLIAVTGGKGGVGKSMLAANLAVAYGSAGSSTLVIDGDLGMADLNLIFGQAPERSLLDVLRGTPSREVLLETHGIHLLPALNGSFQLANLDGALRENLLREVQRLAVQFETVVIDTAAGIDQTTVELAGSASETLVVATADPLSLADAYACLKILSQRQDRGRAYLVPNNVATREQAAVVVDQLTRLADQFLEIEVIALPAIPTDPWVPLASAEGTPLVALRPDSPAARAIRRVARALDGFAITAQTRHSAADTMTQPAQERKERG
ncbi:MAG: P-loop NTPase [Deltaproteobacteria bacterium]|nr:P-loop NTPase [Deltaproteobacteria bacterium]